MEELKELVLPRDLQVPRDVIIPPSIERALLKALPPEARESFREKRVVPAGTRLAGAALRLLRPFLEEEGLLSGQKPSTPRTFEEYWVERGGPVVEIDRPVLTAVLVPRLGISTAGDADPAVVPDWAATVTQLGYQNWASHIWEALGLDPDGEGDGPTPSWEELFSRARKKGLVLVRAREGGSVWAW